MWQKEPLTSGSEVPCAAEKSSELDFDIVKKQGVVWLKVVDNNSRVLSEETEWFSIDANFKRLFPRGTNEVCVIFPQLR